jgi:hypothetical protein
MSAQKCVCFASAVVLMVLAGMVPNALGQFDQMMKMANPFVQFMKELSPSQAREVIQIATNPNITKAQLCQQVEAIAQENGIEEAYQQFNASIHQMQEQMMAAAPQNLAGPALQTFNQVAVSLIRQFGQYVIPFPLKDILSDESQPRGVQCDQVRAVLNGTDPVVRCFLPKGLGICCMGINDQFAAGFAKIGKFFGGAGNN